MKKRKSKKRSVVLKIILLLIAVFLFIGNIESVPFIPDSIKVPVTKIYEKINSSSFSSPFMRNLKKSITPAQKPDEARKLEEKITSYESQQNKNSTPVKTNKNSIYGIEIPGKVGDHQIVAHPGFVLSYNEEYEQPDWVAYTLDLKELNTQNTGRTENFREDPEIATGSATLADYRGSGYDRGHNLSSANRNSSVELNDATFLMSNMSPQIHRFNAGLNLNAENKERDIARYFGENGGSQLYVATGPVFSKNMKTIGENKVAVPEAFYKVWLVQTKEGNWISIGMILPQEYKDGTVRNYLHSVNEIEEISGINFFPNLNDKIEEEVESQNNYKNWIKL